MRLGQLARHLETTTGEIIQFLSAQGIEKKDHPNVKIEEEDEAKVIAHFKPELASKPEVLTPDTPSEPLDSSITSSKKEPIIDSNESMESSHSNLELDQEVPNESDNNRSKDAIELSDKDPSLDDIEEQANDEEEDPYANMEVIKAPKIELPGLKVVGKIELPEPKIKQTEEESTPDAIEESAENPEEPRVIRHHRKNARKKLSEEEREARRLKNKKEKEKRLARQALRKKEQEKRELKQRKEDHYKQKINTTTSAQPKKKKPGKSTLSKENKPIPKTILGKFWRWLNT